MSKIYHDSGAYRSGLEESIALQLKTLKIEGHYEEDKIKFTQPAKKRSYTPDFRLDSSDGRSIFIETKGRFTLSDRQKHLFIKAENPESDIRFVFTNPKAPISKGSKTTYGMWCEKNNFKYSKKTIPEEWFRELGL